MSSDDNNGSLSVMQMVEAAVIAANTAASIWFYKQVQRLDETILQLQDADKASATINNRLATKIGEIETRLASIEGRLAMLEQRPVAVPAISYGGYGNMSQTDPRGYNPSIQPRFHDGGHGGHGGHGGGIPKPDYNQQYPQQQSQPQYPQQQQQFFQQPQHAQNNLTMNHQSPPSGNRSEGRSERISKDQLMADAMSPSK